MRSYFKFLSVLFLFIQPFTEASEGVKVGVALRFTPELNSFAQALYQGIELAKERFEEKNKNLKIELVKYAHKAGHESVDQAASSIIDDKIKYVIGGEMSDEAFALAERFRDQKILLMTPTASNPLLTTGHPLVFRACFSDDQVAKQMAQYVASLKSVRSIGVLHNTANAYSDYLTNDFLEHLRDLTKGKKSPPVSEFRYASEHPDFKNEIEKFKKSNVDLVVAFTLQESLKSFHQLATKASLNPLYIGSDGWGTDESLSKSLFDPAGEQQFKGLRNSYWYAESKAFAVKDFKIAFKKKYSAEANAWNAIAYDSAMVLFQAIAKSKNENDPNEVAEILHSGTFKDTVTAHSIKFNSRNTAIKPLFLYEISKNGTRFVKEVN